MKKFIALLLCLIIMISAVMMTSCAGALLLPSIVEELEILPALPKA